MFYVPENLPYADVTPSNEGLYESDGDVQQPNMQT
jgi:hypothetical protein